VAILRIRGGSIDDEYLDDVARQVGLRALLEDSRHEAT
jgi:hypothetical protein